MCTIIEKFNEKKRAREPQNIPTTCWYPLSFIHNLIFKYLHTATSAKLRLMEFAEIFFSLIKFTSDQQQFLFTRNKNL